MATQAGFWSVDDRLAEISAGGDPLETLNTTVDFERFRPILKRAAGTPRSAKGGRPPLDVVLKLRMLVLQSLHGLNLEATVRRVRDRISWLRFCGLGIADAEPDTVPDADTRWDVREALIKTDALDALFDQLDRVINQAGNSPRAGQIIDASLIWTPRQRNSDSEKAAIKAGKTAPEIWSEKPAKAAQKDTNARWSEEDPQTTWGVVCPTNKYSKANGRKSVVRSKVEHVFGHQKDRMGLVVRTIGLARAKAAITIANMAYNMGRLRWLLSRGAPG